MQVARFRYARGLVHVNGKAPRDRSSPARGAWPKPQGGPDMPDTTTLALDPVATLTSRSKDLIERAYQFVHEIECFESEGGDLLTAVAALWGELDDEVLRATGLDLVWRVLRGLTGDRDATWTELSTACREWLDTNAEIEALR